MDKRQKKIKMQIIENQIKSVVRAINKGDLLVDDIPTETLEKLRKIFKVRTK
jgi:hypothetical protein